MLAVVVVDVGGADSLLHQIEFVFDAQVNVGVAGIEAVAVVEVGDAEEVVEALGAGEFVGDVFQQDFDAALAGEEVELFEGTEGGFEFAVVVLFAADADVLDGEGTGDLFGDFEGALDFVDRGDALDLLRFGDVDDGVGSGAAPDVVGVHGHVEGVELERGVAEPVAELVDLGGVAVVEVLAGAEDFDLGEARGVDFVEGHRGEAVLNEEVGGEGWGHCLISGHFAPAAAVSAAFEPFAVDADGFDDGDAADLFDGVAAGFEQSDGVGGKPAAWILSRVTVVRRC